MSSEMEDICERRKLKVELNYAIEKMPHFVQLKIAALHDSPNLC